MSEKSKSASHSRRRGLLDEAADALTPAEMRSFAAKMLKVADSIDQDWKPPAGGPIFRWPNERSRIERDAFILAENANIEYRNRRRREKYLHVDFLAEPAWDMLLELFMQYAGGARISVTSLCISSSSPSTTALRYIGLLEKHGLVKRSPCLSDKRVTFVELTDSGVLTMGRYLSEAG